MAGKTAAQYAQMSLDEFNKMSLSDINTALKKITKAERQSVARVEKSGAYSPAVAGLEKSGGHIHTGYKDINKARAELQRGINFMNSSTRTIPGAKAHHAQSAAYAGLPSTISPEELGKLYKQRDKILEDFPGQADKVLNKHYRSIDQEIFEKLRDGESTDDILESLMQEYEELQEREFEELDYYEGEFSE